MPWKEPGHSEPTQPIQKEWHGVVETERRHKDKAENSPKGWLDLQLRPISQQKAFFSPLNKPWARKDHPLSVSLIPLSSIWLPFSVKHILTHFFKFLHEAVTLVQLPFLFLSSLCTPVSTHMSRHAHMSASVQPSREPPSSSLSSLCAISLADVIVSPAGVLSGSEVGASERV